MRLTCLHALASRQALNRNPSAALALVSCSDSLAGRSRSAHGDPRHCEYHGRAKQRPEAARNVEKHDVEIPRWLRLRLARKGDALRDADAKNDEDPEQA